MSKIKIEFPLFRGKTYLKKKKPQIDNCCCCGCDCCCGCCCGLSLELPTVVGLCEYWQPQKYLRKLAKTCFCFFFFFLVRLWLVPGTSWHFYLVKGEAGRKSTTTTTATTTTATTNKATTTTLTTTATSSIFFIAFYFNRAVKLQLFCSCICTWRKGGGTNPKGVVTLKKNMAF